MRSVGILGAVLALFASAVWLNPDSFRVEDFSTWSGISSIYIVFVGLWLSGLVAAGTLWLLTKSFRPHVRDLLTTSLLACALAPVLAGRRGSAPFLTVIFYWRADSDFWLYSVSFVLTWMMLFAGAVFLHFIFRTFTRNENAT